MRFPFLITIIEASKNRRNKIYIIFLLVDWSDELNQLVFALSSFNCIIKQENNWKEEKRRKTCKLILYSMSLYHHFHSDLLSSLIITVLFFFRFSLFAPLFKRKKKSFFSFSRTNKLIELSLLIIYYFLFLLFLFNKWIVLTTHTLLSIHYPFITPHYTLIYTYLFDFIYLIN